MSYKIKIFPYVVDLQISFLVSKVLIKILRFSTIIKYFNKFCGGIIITMCLYQFIFNSWFII